MKVLFLLLFSISAYADQTIIVDRFVLESEAASIVCPAFIALTKTKDACELVDTPGTDECINVPIGPCEMLEFDSGVNFSNISLRTDLLMPGGPATATLPTITSSDFFKLMVTADFGVPGQLLQTDGDFNQDWTPYSFPSTTPTTGQILEASSSATLTFVTPFEAGNETFFWIGPTAAVSNNVDVPFFTTTPTRTNSNLGSSADIVLRISDTVMRVVNTGLHNITFTWESSGNSDDF